MVTNCLQVVLWDKIVMRGDNPVVDLNNLRTKYYFFDDGQFSFLFSSHLDKMNNFFGTEACRFLNKLLFPYSNLEAGG